MKKLSLGDNPNILREHIADESVDPIYFGPPFNLKCDAGFKWYFCDMKVAVLFFLISLSAQAGAQSQEPLAKFIGHRVWIDPRYNTSILSLSSTPERFTPLIITSIAFVDSSSRPVEVTCKAKGRTYIFKIGRDDFSEYFIESEPRRFEKWSKNIWKAIDNGNAVIGMTEEQAKLAWGEPTEVNTTTLRSGRSEQWVYASSIGNAYLYFNNGILDAIQNK
jgi:hypothetical protein